MTIKLFIQASLSGSILFFCFWMIGSNPGSEAKVAYFWGTAQSIVTYWLPSPIANKKEEDK
jgi:hypothetical protein